MNTPPRFSPDQESIVLRILWMLLFALVWYIAQFILGALVLLQLICRLVYGAPNAALMSFGDSLSRYLAQIGQFGSFHTETKPWPFSSWPSSGPLGGRPEAAEPPVAPAAVTPAPGPTGTAREQEPPV
ncbi:MULTISPECIES: DUF4389 domain-containing protein [Pseudomonas]|uniref:DUF4389 domain-containing protein n=1 Tax=Pseudomonas quercus TaxID=2722792 RepID=A0ABX0YKA7_9PSED|nr:MULTISPECIES: DUF4389 domain-containing protein [Pseudomonas]MBF7144905.1 DUF4389 domain-containing protein [Pseudomonas sp. LY10J]NJP03456.1 DUF4389 domain-containing protein [Pseudomonas quercus]